MAFCAEGAKLHTKYIMYVCVHVNVFVYLYMHFYVYVCVSCEF